MNTKTLSILAVLTVAAVVAVIWTRPAPPPGTVNRQLLAPDLEPQINQVKRLHVIKAGNETVADLRRTEHGWVVANKADYPADLGRVRETLLTLASARVVEAKTDNPKNYERLGVQDVSDAKATGVRLDLDGLAAPLSLVIGNPASGGSVGFYARRTDAVQSVLASGSLTVAREPQQWLERLILDIPANRLQAVVIRQPGGETLTVEKAKREQSDFTVAGGVPTGRQLSAPSAANPLGSVLASLRLEDVLLAATFKPGVAQPVEAEYRTFDGLRVLARAFEQEDRRYVQFTVSFDEAQARRFPPPELAGKPANGGQPPTDRDAAVREEAQRLATRLQPWVYVVPAFKYDNLTRRLEDLLQPLKPQADKGGPPSPSVTAGQAGTLPATTNDAEEEAEEAVPEGEEVEDEAEGEAGSEEAAEPTEGAVSAEDGQPVAPPEADEEPVEEDSPLPGTAGRK